MLLSIPPIGGHYLVDVLAGGALALGAIAVQRCTRWPCTRAEILSAPVPPLSRWSAAFKPTRRPCS